MPTTLVFSNRTETLLDAFCEAVAAARAEDGVWTPIPVVVPNRTHQHFLQQGLVDRMGIAANFEFAFLDGLWRSHLPEGMRLLDQPSLQGAILGLLADAAFMGHPELGGLRRYLEADTDGRRIAQLAAQIATLFEEYALSRPEWLEAWAAGTPADTRAPEGLEAWQRRLWRALVERLARGGSGWLTLGQFLEGGAFPTAAFPPRVFVFGLSQTARVYHTGLQRLGRRTDLHLFTLNPCDEFWTEVPEARATRRGIAFHRVDGDADAPDPFGLNAAGNPALVAWGRSGRENIRLLNEGQDWNAEERFDPEPRFTHLLGLVQALVQKNRPFDGVEPQPADASLRIHGCASPRREAEVVATEIWEYLRTHPGARFSDVAVLVPPSAKEAYLHHLQAAFEATRNLPWRVADEGSRRQQELLEAADLLLRLPLGAFTRAEVLRVLDHPAVRSRFPELEGSWASLCAELGIIRGTAEDADSDAYFQRDLWNWDQGLHRLALSAFMEAGTGLAQGDGSYRAIPPTPEAGAFLGLVRGLLADAQALRHRRQSARGWAQDLAGYLRGFLGEADGSDGSAVQRLLEGLGRLADRELEGLPPLELAFGTAFEMAQEALGRVKTGSPGTLGHGVAVGGFDALRGLPFRAIFILGLGEGIFPGTDARSPFDLRSHRWRPGDVSRPEQDRYAFLEALLCARDTLQITYPTRDPLTAERRQPSSVLLDLEGMVAPLLAPGASLRRDHPLHRFDARYGAGELPNHLPEAWREGEAAELGRALREAAGAQDLPNLQALNLPHQAAPRVQELVRAVPALPPAALPHKLRLSLGQLKRWFECPIQGAACIRLGLRLLDEEDLQDVRTEPFALDALARHALLREAFWASVQGAPPEAALARAHRLRQELGLAPIALFGDVERQRLLRVLQLWLERRPEGAPHRLRLGGGEAGEDLPETRLPALTLSAAGVELSLEGATLPVVGDAFILLTERKPATPKRRAEPGDRRNALAPWLQHLVLVAGGHAAPTEVRFISASDDETPGWTLPLGPLSPEAAREHLTGCLEALLAGPWEPLPFEAALRPVPEGAAALAAWMREPDTFPRVFERGPLSGVADLPPAEAWRDQARARYGDLLERLEGAGSTP